jgi:hypothetical protein
MGQAAQGLLDAPLVLLLGLALRGEELRRGRRKIVERERNVVAVEIEFEDAVYGFTGRSKRIKRGLEKSPLKIPTNGGAKNNEPGMQLLLRIKTSKVARVVGDQSEVAVAGVAHNVPVFPTSPADVRDVVGLMAGLSGHSNQMNAEAFVDEKPHGSVMVSNPRRRLCNG